MDSNQPMFKGKSIEEWKRLFIDAKQGGVRVEDFCRQNGLGIGGAITALSKIINNKNITCFQKAPGGSYKYPLEEIDTPKASTTTKAKRPYNKKTVSPSYQTIALDPSPASKPVFCLVIAFNSREEAFLAMSKL